MLKRTQILLSIMLVLMAYSCQNTGKPAKGSSDEIKGDIIIFHAGSLSYPFQQIARNFETEFPGTKVLLEAAGSVDCARKITDLHKPCDLMASSDYKIIEKLLMPSHADWYLPFAGNEMVIVYTPESKYSELINADNWFEILQYDDVRYGRSDPNADPCGYRTLMVMQLAEDYYHVPGLSGKLSSKDQKYIRPKEVDLLALLELHETDYIFIYKSVAIQHGLSYLSLQDEINLKDMERNENYAKASVRLKGKTPDQTIEIKGEAINYAITMIKDSPNPAGAKAFLNYLLDNEKGMKVMTQSGHNSLLPVSGHDLGKIPEYIKKHTKALNH